MKKKILAIALVVAMLGIALLSGTLAYFTDKEVEDNEFVIGDIDITLKESNGDGKEDEEYKDWLADQYLFPGAPIAKNVWVENAGANEAYLRVKITVPQYLVAVWAKDLNAAWTIASTTVNADKSTTYVLEYNTILAKGDKTPICLEAITIDPYTDKQINGADIQTVNVVAEAIQTVGFENNPAAAFAALDAQLTVNEYEGKNYVQAADDTALAAALAGAQPGDVIALAADVDYGTVALDALDGVTIVGAAGTNANFTVAADAVIGEVTLANFDFQGANVITVANAATADITVVDSTFSGSGSQAIKASGENVAITLTDCVFDSYKYVIYDFGRPLDYLKIEDCAIEGATSWVVQQNNSTAPAYTLIMTGNTFTDCTGGFVKYLSSTAGEFVFTNNTIVDCAGHDGSDAKWFDVKYAAGATVDVSGNTLDGAAWNPGVAEGLGK
ncbi:MAG: hypothetical protein E7654_00645 [Ruminococcaceae bacterium]|nr:hypothetical protein [Oscillospiraceae bacterium]